MLVFGGVTKRLGHQIGEVDQCQLKRIGSLPFLFANGGCAVSQDKIFLCFPSEDVEQHRKERACFTATDDLQFTQLVADSVYDHQDIHIGGSQDTILAVGTLKGPPKSEVYQGDSWIPLKEDYPFHKVMWRNAVISYRGSFELEKPIGYLK